MDDLWAKAVAGLTTLLPRGPWVQPPVSAQRERKP
jgi:hypothetical protein